MSLNKYDPLTGTLTTLANGQRIWLGTKAAHDAAEAAGTLPTNCLIAITDDGDVSGVVDEVKEGDKNPVTSDAVYGYIKIVNKSVTLSFNTGLATISDPDITPDSIVTCGANQDVTIKITPYQVPRNGSIAVCGRNWVSNAWASGNVTFTYSILKRVAVSAT